MTRVSFAAFCFLAASFVPQLARAVASAELYTASSYRYGRIEARVRFAAGDGVVSSFFLWKDGSEIAGTFWNELDFEKLGATCRLETNALFGNPVAGHVQRPTLSQDLCGEFHTYTYEWTPESIAWLIDGVEVRRETGPAAVAFADNTPAGMQIRFNIWPGDASFGGNFSPDILPVHQYIDWVQYSSYADGAFSLEWREDFDGAALPAEWLTGSWASPKNKSTHAPGNVNLLGGYAVLSLTADDAIGPAGATPEGGPSAPPSGSAGSTGTAGAPAESGEGGGCSLSPPRSGPRHGLLAGLGVCAALALRRVRGALGSRRHGSGA